MTERLLEKSESGGEQIDLHETSKRNLERLKATAEKTEHDHNIGKLQESIHKTAISAKEVTVGEREETNSQPVLGAQKALKTDAYRRTIQKVRSHLNPTERTFSKVIHHRLIEPVSEFSSRTVGRPSGILGGGIVALVGSGIVLYMAKHYGFRYNFTIFLLLVVGGFGTSLLLEVAARFLRRR